MALNTAGSAPAIWHMYSKILSVTGVVFMAVSVLLKKIRAAAACAAPGLRGSPKKK
jgi:hypothetical protein